MKCKFIFATISMLIFLCLSVLAFSPLQVAPVTTAGSLAACPAATMCIPITVTDFTQITGISLRLDYNPTLMTYTGYSNANSSLNGFIVTNVSVNSTLSKLMILWTDINPLTLASGAKLVDLCFTYTSGSPTLSFNNTSNVGADCEYADLIGDPLPDTPTSIYYINATITNNGVGAAGIITGLTTLCQGTTGVAYSVPPITNATGYNWTFPSGCSIASGANTNSITVDFSLSAVSGNITVAGINTCGMGTSSTIVVTVNSVPFPTITGSNQICLPATGVVYTTESGQNNYQWTVSAGGTITGGISTNSITVTWNVAGAQTISVNYTNLGGCSATTSTIKNVSVNSTPTPTIYGSTIVIVGATGIIYATEAGMTGYNWTVSLGGSITAGSGTNSITVLWTTPGNKTVTVNYTNANGCTAVTPDTLLVTVTPRNAPITIAGSSTVCPNTGLSIPVIVNDFSDITTISLRLDFNPLLMTYSGFANLNSNLTGIIINEVTVSPSSHKILITWINIIPLTLSDGTKLVDLNFTLLSGSPTLTFNNTDNGGSDCEYADAYGNTMTDIPTATYYFNSIITNNGVGTAGTITGVSIVCQGQSGIGYSVPAINNATGYNWTLPIGASIASGTNTNSILVNFSASSLSGNVIVSGTNICGNGVASTAFPVLINPLPGAADTITGPVLVYQGQMGVAYFVAPIPNATGYTWSFPTGVTIATGNNTNSITVDFATDAQSGTFIVTGTNGCGNGQVSPPLVVSVGFNINGTYTYNNSVNTPLDSLKVYLNLNGSKIDSTNTNLLGQYHFTGKAPAIYTISAITNKPWAGVNATDAIKIQRHFAGLEILTIPVRLLAADVNLSNSINATDAIKVKRRFSGLDSTFLRGNWIFAKPTGGDTALVINTDLTVDFQGLCVGDVNGSNVPSPGFMSLNTPITHDFQVSMEVLPRKEFYLPVKIKTDLQVGAISLVLNYPHELLEFMDVSTSQGTIVFKAKEGQIPIAWSETDLLNLKKGETLVILKLKATEKFQVEKEFSFSLGDDSEFTGKK